VELVIRILRVNRAVLGKPECSVYNRRSLRSRNRACGGPVRPSPMSAGHSPRREAAAGRLREDAGFAARAGLRHAAAVTSYTRRYLDGDHEGVWAELRKLGPVPGTLAEDCAAVAAETMRRVGRHVERLAEQLTALGLVPSRPLRTPPTEADHAELDALTEEIGALPAALDACLRHVGGVWFAGDCPTVGLYYESWDQYADSRLLPDPLVLPDASYLRYSWEGYAEEVEEDQSRAGEVFWFDFAPDELHKANVSGASHHVELPGTVADPVLEGVRGRPGVTLVEYLRHSVAWGAMPGWEFHPGHEPEALAGLRREPDF
jgi:hypothetical protein